MDLQARRTVRGPASVAVLLLLAACGGSSTSPSTFSWTGTWRGTVTDATAGTGNLTMALDQAGSAVTGTASITVLGLALEGPVEGTVTESAIEATATSPAPLACTLSFRGSRVGETVTGTYQSTVCLLPVSGSFSMTKQ